MIIPFRAGREALSRRPCASDAEWLERFRHREALSRRPFVSDTEWFGRYRRARYRVRRWRLEDATNIHHLGNLYEPGWVTLVLRGGSKYVEFFPYLHGSARRRRRSPNRKALHNEARRWAEVVSRGWVAEAGLGRWPDDCGALPAWT